MLDEVGGMTTSGEYADTAVKLDEGAAGGVSELEDDVGGTTISGKYADTEELVVSGRGATLDELEGGGGIDELEDKVGGTTLSGMYAEGEEELVVSGRGGAISELDDEVGGTMLSGMYAETDEELVGSGGGTTLDELEGVGSSTTSDEWGEAAGTLEEDVKGAGEDEGVLVAVSVQVTVYVRVVGCGCSHVFTNVLVSTEFAVCGNAPAPSMLASHAEGSKLGIHCDEVEACGTSGSTGGTDEGSSEGDGDGISGKTADELVLGCAAASGCTVVLVYARSLLTSFGKLCFCRSPS